MISYSWSGSSLRRRTIAGILCFLADRNESIRSRQLSSVKWSRSRLCIRHGRHFAGSIHSVLSATDRSEEHTSELQSLMRISYAVFCLKKKKNQTITTIKTEQINIGHKL